MLSLIMAFYRNQPMLDRHLEVWGSYPEAVKAGLRIYVVDDGSPDPAVVRDVGLDLRVYRIKQNIPWNWYGARNLAMSESPDDWRLMTDMDHLLEPDQAEALLAMPKAKGKFYMPQRRWPDGSLYHKRHPNSFVVHRDDFWACGGYDEDFAGYYGSDSTFRRNLSAFAERVDTDAFFLTHYEGYEGANTTDFGRKGSEYHAPRVPRLQAKRKGKPYVAQNPLRFDWVRVQ